MLSFRSQIFAEKSCCVKPAGTHRPMPFYASYVADEKIRGNLPFPRVREEELLYILHKLRELRLWPGSLGRLSQKLRSSTQRSSLVRTVAQPKAAPVSSSREEMSKEMGKGAVRREEDGGLGTAVSVGLPKGVAC